MSKYNQNISHLQMVQCWHELQIRASVGRGIAPAVRGIPPLALICDQGHPV